MREGAKEQKENNNNGGGGNKAVCEKKRPRPKEVGGRRRVQARQVSFFGGIG